jgi:hypothetical protein
MKPLWRMNSGKFAGYRVEDRMYSPEGDNIGYFDGRILYTLNGQCIGEAYLNKWVGKRVNIGYRYGESKDQLESINCKPKEDQENPMEIEAWEDSIFFLTGVLGLQKRRWDN